MNILRNIILIYLFLFNLTLFGQKDNPWQLTSEKPTKGYSKFLTRDSTTESYMFTAGVKYQYTVYSPSFSSNGYYLTAGINLARFFSRKFVFGVFGEYSLKHNLFQKDVKSNAFISDFNNDFNSVYNSPEDSAVAEQFQSNLTYGHFGKGSYAALGVMFSPFPNKYGGILISAKYGSTSHYCSFYDNKRVNNGESDHIYFTTEFYALELTVKPYSFFRNSSYWKGKNFVYRSLSLSFSYDYFKINNIKVYNTKLTQMVNNDFMSKYGTTNRFIIAIGCTIY